MSGPAAVAYGRLRPLDVEEHGLPVMIRLTREVRFSVDRDWAGRVGTGRPVTNSWAGWPSAVGIVPYLRLRATVRGAADPVTGYVCNISVIDDLLRMHAIPHTAEALAAHGWRMSAEHLLRDLWRGVTSNMPPAIALERLELWTTPCLRYTIHGADTTMVHLTQQFEFSAAHRLHCAALDDATNRRVFGKCNNPNGHGHNYVLEVTVAGVPDARTGAVLPLPQFEQTVRACVIDRLDHKHLNEDTAEFRDVNPSVENIARVIWRLLADHVGPARLANIRVYETPKTWADYQGESPGTQD